MAFLSTSQGYAAVWCLSHVYLISRLSVHYHIDHSQILLGYNKAWGYTSYILTQYIVPLVMHSLLVRDREIYINLLSPNQ